MVSPHEYGNPVGDPAGFPMRPDHNAEAGDTIASLIIGGIGIAGGVVVFFSSVVAGSVIAAIGLGLAAWGWWNLGRARAVKARRVRVFEHGLTGVGVKGGPEHAYRWTDVDFVSEGKVVYYGRGRLLSCSHPVIVVGLRNGDSHTYTGGDLVDTLATLVNRVLLDPMRARVAGGQTVDLGSVKIDSTMLAYTSGDRTETIPWRQISGLAVEQKFIAPKTATEVLVVRTASGARGVGNPRNRRALITLAGALAA